MHPLCFSRVNNHLKLLKLWLIGLKCAPRPWRCRWPCTVFCIFCKLLATDESAQWWGFLMTEQITSIYVFWTVCFLWPELKQSEGEAFVAPAGYAVVSVNRAQDYDYERNACNPFRNRFSSLLPHSVSSLPTKMKTTASISIAAIIISSLRHHIFLRGPVFHSKAQSIRW